MLVTDIKRKAESGCSALVAECSHLFPGITAHIMPSYPGVHHKLEFQILNLSLDGEPAHKQFLIKTLVRVHHNSHFGMVLIVYIDIPIVDFDSFQAPLSYCFLYGFAY